MIVRKAQATWTDNLEDGEGTMESESFSGSYSFATRFENGDGVNPEELIGDAHAGCYSMALAHELDEAGYTPVSVRSTAEVHFDPDALEITTVELRTEATVEGIDEQTFQEIAGAANDGCPVSKALAGTDIKLVSARLQS
jgi:osmotically inducible protein OsmC